MLPSPMSTTSMTYTFLHSHEANLRRSQSSFLDNFPNLIHYSNDIHAILHHAIHVIVHVLWLLHYNSNAREFIQVGLDTG